jgi:DegV family protein with EDD domain
MVLTELDSVNLYHAFVCGGNEIIRRRRHINSINVFPVADGDTGTNLALTLDSLIHNTTVFPSAGATLQSMAEAVLKGARGNSGIIFAEFIAGLADFLQKFEKISSESFSNALNTAVQKARAAIQKPVEGTILTVLQVWANAIEEHKQLRDFALIFQNTLQKAHNALMNTRNQLEVLRHANVVDAGAAGFYHFLCGVTEYLRSGQKPEIAVGDRLTEEIQEVVHDDRYPEYRYCAEGLLRGRDIDTRKLLSQLQSQGNSLIVAGGGTMVRVHLHTDEPALFFRVLSRFGSIAEQKVDDMVSEFEVVHHRKYPIALVTDSVCDLPKELIDRYQIHVVPLSLIFGGVQYIDGVTITNADIYASLDSVDPYPSTSQPPPTAFRKLYSFLATHYESIVAIHVSASLSGTYNLSCREAEKVQDIPITVIDSKRNSGAQALIVLEAAEAIAAGRSHAEVVAAVEAAIPKSDILVSLHSLRYMVKGGRVKPLAGYLARLLNFTPIVSLDAQGEAVLYGKAFSRRQSRKKLFALVKAIIQKGRLKHFAVVHAQNEPMAIQVAETIEKIVGMPALFIQEITPIVGLHAGKGACAVVTLRAE